MFKTLLKLTVTLVVTLSMVACGSGTGTSTVTIQKPTKPTVILVFGDSISAGYGISENGTPYQQVTPGKTYVELAQQRIQSENIAEFAPVTVINASLGSEFTSEAISRLPALLAQYKPTHVLLAHGTNDAWSDVPNSDISNNLSTMVTMAKNSGAKVLLADVTFSLYGLDFANKYSQMVVSLANASGATYVNLLSGVFGDPQYYLDDRVHLNDAAQPFMMNNVWEKLIPLLD